jgi:hypothetical protein
MSIGTRAAACSSCGKRLNRKQWYYRNGKYYCKKRCWATESEKAAAEAREKGEKKGAQVEAAKEAEEPKAAKAAPAAS